MRNLGYLVGVLAAAIVASSAGAISTGFVYAEGDGWNHKAGSMISFDGGAHLEDRTLGSYNILLDSTGLTDTTKAGGEGTLLLQQLAKSQNYEVSGFAVNYEPIIPSSKSVKYELFTPQEMPNMTEPKALDLRRLWNGYHGLTALEGKQTIGGVKCDAEDINAAFAACVIEIVTEDPSNKYDLTDGQLRVQNSTIRGLASQWLTNLGSDQPDIGLRFLVDDNNGSNKDFRDFVLVVDGFGAAPMVPEPLTMTGLSMALFAGAAYIRRRRAA